MQTDIEGKIRSKIEAILINDARTYSELRMMATGEEPFDSDPFSEERGRKNPLLPFCSLAEGGEDPVRR